MRSYVVVTARENASLKWLVGELAVTLKVHMNEVYRHPQLCATGLPAIREVKVVRSGITRWRDNVPHPPCSKFRPTAAQVRAYLEQARRVPTYREAHDTLIMMPCQAEGTVTFSDGRRGRWRVEQARFGDLTIVGRTPMFLYAPRNPGHPFLD